MRMDAALYLLLSVTQYIDLYKSSIIYDELVTFHKISHPYFRPRAPSACSFPVNSQGSEIVIPKKCSD